MENQEAYKAAKKRVAAKVQFYKHASVFIGVMILLLFINYTTNPDFLWVIYPMLGWGFAVLLHGLRVFLFSGKTFTERMIDKEMEKEGW